MEITFDIPALGIVPVVGILATLGLILLLRWIIGFLT